ncbi:16311_t:CDS:2 [Acaulospora morrowiae]|uniref:16311_t:CDS:1 n=1 Tax=Acaulospora morrowiae TaxID=94023 RepID=A0A9N8W216_9GLOM|nr:16311_t:CDS:2 [Acaulospora morrowiae]
MATYTNLDGSSLVRTFSNSYSLATAQMLLKNYHYYRALWWEKGDFNQKAMWEEVTIIGLGAIRTRADNSEKEADACFRPKKPRVAPPNGSDEKDEPWPNLVIEVAYSESEPRVLEKVKDFWLRNLSRAHDAIVVKIDKPPEDETPSRMQFNLPGMALLCQGQTQKNNRYPSSDLRNVINKG